MCTAARRSLVLKKAQHAKNGQPRRNSIKAYPASFALVGSHSTICDAGLTNPYVDKLGINSPMTNNPVWTPTSRTY